MRSRAIAGVDGWLEQAEAVLEQQQERSLSPSLAPNWDAGGVETVIAFTEFSEGLEDLLGSLCRRPGRWILIAEAGPYRYWQALCFEDGSLVAEVGSNHWCEPHDQMTPDDEVRLRILGWDDPVPPGRPNWTRVEFTTSPDVAAVALQAVETLGGVLGAGGGEKVVVKLFSSPNRGDTPASPEYVTAPACGGTPGSDRPSWGS
jgi:hypothetical protein